MTEATVRGLALLIHSSVSETLEVSCMSSSCVLACVRACVCVCRACVCVCVILRLTLRMEMRKQKRLNKKRAHCAAAIAGPCRAELGETHLAIAGCLVAGVGCPSLCLSFSPIK